MQNISIKNLAPLVLCLITFGCNTEPKVIKANSEKETPKNETGIFSDQTDHTGHDHSKNQSSAHDNNVHSIIVKEVLPTSRYVYLKVSEHNKDFWIATTKQEVKVGEAYFYSGGLLKNNFLSKEHNRTFEQIYLVSSIVKANHGSRNQPASTAQPTETSIDKKIIVEGSIRIADIVAAPEKYINKTIQISGKCVKVNRNIMNRHWIHLKDGSMDDYDFVITSDKDIPEGHTVTLTGQVSINKDFGAGYKYDIIVEGGRVISTI